MKIGEFIGVGHEMKAVRLKLRISQKAMAVILKVPQSTYSNYENEHAEPPVELIQKFCAETGTDMIELLKLDKEKF